LQQMMIMMMMMKVHFVQLVVVFHQRTSTSTKMTSTLGKTWTMNLDLIWFDWSRWEWWFKSVVSVLFLYYRIFEWSIEKKKQTMLIIRYQFKAEKNLQSVRIDGMSCSLGELKRFIVAKNITFRKTSFQRWLWFLDQ
jgi:hypothetical protein